ncbi:hypothetical protein QQF64_032783, partial [Cirrhinus molitorella]
MTGAPTNQRRGGGARRTRSTSLHWRERRLATQTGGANPDSIITNIIITLDLQRSAVKERRKPHRPLTAHQYGRQDIRSAGNGRDSGVVLERALLAPAQPFCMFMIRLVFERFIARPCALGLKIQANGPQKAQPNAILEKVFTAITKHPDEKRLEGLSKQLDWDVRTIQRWFRQRRNQEKPSTLARFCESMWRFTFYLYIFTYGVRFLKK